MKSFFKNEGLLKVVVSKGVISTFEVNELKNKQQIIFTDRECGKPCSLYFNDRLLAYCEVVIIDNKYGVRLDEIKDWKPEPVLTKTLLEDNEILNSELILGERKVLLEDVFKLTNGSIIPINTEIDFERDKPTIGKLLVSGYEVAHGKICYLDEYWSLEVTKVIFSKGNTIPRRDSYLKTFNKLKYYDFSRPDCVTRSNINSFSRIHDFFGNYINGKVELVDQMTWGEFKNEFPNLNMITIIKKERKYNSKNGNYKYYLPLDSLNDNVETEEYCKQHAIKRANSQVMEKVTIVFGSHTIKKQFSDNFEEMKNLLETSWRDKTNISFGNRSEVNIKVKESQFIDDYEMIILVKMIVEKEILILIYPLTYFAQILNELN